MFLGDRLCGAQHRREAVEVELLPYDGFHDGAALLLARAALELLLVLWDLTEAVREGGAGRAAHCSGVADGGGRRGLIRLRLEQACVDARFLHLPEYLFGLPFPEATFRLFEEVPPLDLVVQAGSAECGLDLVDLRCRSGLARKSHERHHQKKLGVVEGERALHGKGRARNSGQGAAGNREYLQGGITGCDPPQGVEDLRIGGAGLADDLQ